MSTTLPAPLISSLDTYMKYVEQQMALVNPARAGSLMGMAEATDWPQIDVVDGGIYLLHLGSSPVNSRQSTQMFTLFSHTMQWVWLDIGNDIQAGQVAANRGDRYRTSVTVFEDLFRASYPGFCGKAVTSADVQGNVTFTITAPLEMVRWSQLRLRKTMKIDSGVIYGVAALEVLGYEQMLPAVDVATSFPPLPM